LEADGILKRYNYLGIRVGTEAELSPRIPLTSIAYSMNALRADTARVAIGAPGDGVWSVSGSDIYRLNGNVGIGVNLPQRKFQIGGLIQGIGFERRNGRQNERMDLSI
jgi:hypothetical protein